MCLPRWDSLTVPEIAADFSKTPAIRLQWGMLQPAMDHGEKRRQLSDQPSELGCIYHARLRRKAVEELPPKEKICLLAISHLANELNILQKLTLWSIRDGLENPGPVQQAAICQGLFLIRITAGKLHEGYKLIRTSYHGAAVSKTYDSHLKPESKRALRRIKKYFKSGGSLLSGIRNDYAFHFTPDKFSEALESLPAEEKMECYLAGHHANNFLYFADLVAITSMLGSVTPERMKKLTDDLGNISKDFMQFASDFVGAVIERHPGILEGEAEPLDLGELRDFETISIPFFAAVKSEH